VAKEPVITVNGKSLTQGQAMTIRVALNSFAMDLAENGLGDDDHGKTMVKLYTQNASEILSIMHGADK
jgi:hypothetical protein